MPNTRISDLTAATSVAGTDVYPSVQTAGVGPVKTSLTQITAFALANAPAGAVATPSIAPTGDTNTGFWFPAADTIAASTGGSERLRITSAGLVGIGTASPAYKLQVGTGANSATATAAFLGGYTVFENAAGTGNPSITFNNDIDTGILNPAANNIAFVTNASERMRIDSAGNVGIGVSPSAWSAMRAVQNGSVSLATDLAVPRARVMTNTFYDGSGYKFIDASSLYASMYVQNSADGAHQWFTSTAAGTSGNTATLSELMRITSAGLVGIGTTSPAVRLSVEDTSGSARIQVKETTTNNLIQLEANTAFHTLFSTGNVPLYIYTQGQIRQTITGAGNVGIGTTSPSTTLDVRAAQATFGLTSTTTTNAAYSSFNNAGGIFYAGIDNSGGSAFSGTAYSSVLWSTAATPMVFATNGSEKMRITSAGNVGIGVTAPDERLHVIGNISTGGIGANLGILFTAVLTGAIPSSSVKCQIASMNSGSGYVAGDLLLQPRTGVSASTIFATEGTERMRITSAGNVLIGTTSSPTTGTQCLTIETETAPTATPADTVTFYSSDLSAGNTIPSIYTEGTGIVSSNTGTTNLSNRIAVRINGTVYYLLAASSA